MKKSFLTFILVVTMLFAAVGAGQAEEPKFETYYHVTYQIQETGQTKVTQDITLKNLTQNYYAPTYTLTIGTTAVTGITARDSVGAMEVKTTTNQEENQTTITVRLNQEVVGLNKTADWTVTYFTQDTAMKNGQVWEVVVPRISVYDTTTRLVQYDVNLIVPQSFGPELYIVPYSPSSEQNNTRVYHFDKQQIEPGGVSATFGEHQVFAFNLTYHLKNASRLSTGQKISLPPDIWGYQKVIYTSLKPQPVAITVDLDGNYLASYRLKGGQELDVNLQGLAQLLSRHIDLKNSGEFDKINAEIIKVYTREQAFWPVQEEEIQTLSQKLTDRQDGVADNAYRIYDYVINNLKYNQERANQEELTRLGALGALKNPDQAVCTEFADLFITLARAAGIPAREVDGYAYTADIATKPLSVRLGSGDVLHAWAQFFDPNLGWVSIDPTWASTTNGLNFFNKLDTNHLAFVIKGIDSQTPYPAGSYKTDPVRQINDVKVGFARADQIPEERINLEILTHLPRQAIAGLGFKGKVELENKGNVTIFNPRVVVNSPLFSVKGYASGEALPPYAKTTRTFKFGSPLVWTARKEDLEVQVLYEDFEGRPLSQIVHQPIRLVPFYLAWQFWLLGAVLSSALYVIYCYRKHQPLFPGPLSARRPPHPRAPNQ